MIQQFETLQQRDPQECGFSGTEIEKEELRETSIQLWPARDHRVSP
jgi:hypothetical protein